MKRMITFMAATAAFFVATTASADGWFKAIFTPGDDDQQASWITTVVGSTGSPFEVGDSFGSYCGLILMGSDSGYEAYGIFNCAHYLTKVDAIYSATNVSVDYEPNPTVLGFGTGKFSGVQGTCSVGGGGSIDRVAIECDWKWGG